MDAVRMGQPHEDTRDSDRWRALGHRIAMRRDHLRYSQRELGRLAGVSYAYIADIERGRKRASVDILRRIARALDLPYEELGRLAGYADPPKTVDAAYDDMRRDFADLSRRIAEFGRRYGFIPGDGPTHDKPGG